MLNIGNAPCSWGVEFPDDPKNPSWERVLDEAKKAGYKAMELGPVGFIPENPELVKKAYANRGLTLVAGVIFQPFHDPDSFDKLIDNVRRTCKALSAQGTKRLVFIDSISQNRVTTAGRKEEAPRLEGDDLKKMIERIKKACEIASGDFGCVPAMHAHAAGYVEFEDELLKVLDAIDDSLLKICFDTGHATYAGFDIIDFYKKHADRVSYIHLKDIDPKVKADAIKNRTSFYDACAQGIFCNLGKGEVDFLAFKKALEEKGYNGWATVEQDCDPAGKNSPLDDSIENLNFLKSIGLSN